MPKRCFITITMTPENHNPPVLRRSLFHLILIVCLLAVPTFNADAERRLLPEPIAPVDTGNRAVDTLIERARQFMTNDAPELAAAELERAIRISPRSALVWHELARVRFSQGRSEDAEALATKADVLAEDSTVKSANHRLLNMSRVANGKPVVPGSQVTFAETDNPTTAATAPIPPDGDTQSDQATAADGLLTPPRAATSAEPADANMQNWHDVPVVGGVGPEDTKAQSRRNGSAGAATASSDSLPVVVERSAPVQRSATATASRTATGSSSRAVPQSRGAPVEDRSINRR